MKTIGKISPIKKELRSSVKTMQVELARQGYTRVPGTFIIKFPYKEISGKYRTGLDENAAYIDRIKDETERNLEKDRVKKLRLKLEEELNKDLSPNSKFWQHNLASDTDDNNFVQAAKLIDGDNLFDLSNPWKLLQFSWLRVHPTIASSYQAWARGEFPADTQFYVCDEEVEHEIAFKKKAAVNKAIIAFEAMTPDKRLKVARLMGLPVTDDMKQFVVYNLIDNIFKQSEYTKGQYQGLAPVDVFNRFAEMNEELLFLKDTIKQAITHSIYRQKPDGSIWKGEAQVAKSEEELIKHLKNEDNQEDLIILQEELKRKKLAEV